MTPGAGAKRVEIKTDHFVLKDSDQSAGTNVLSYQWLLVTSYEGPLPSIFIKIRLCLKYLSPV